MAFKHKKIIRDLGLIIGPFPIKNEQKPLKMVYIIPNFLALHFGENFPETTNKST